MTLKKTITVSVLLHICFFSAALLLSARLLGGSGKLPEADVVFISLAAPEPKAVRAAVVPAMALIVKKAEKQSVALKVEPETAIADVAFEKAEAKSEELTPAEVVPAIKEILKEELAAGAGPLEEEGNHIEEVKVVQAGYDQPLADNPGVDEAVQGAGILPGTIELISMAIERVKTYPAIARKRGIEGTVHVSFNVMANGNPYGITVLKSSGFSILDKATVKVVKKAAPFPLIANRIELPVVYRLSN